MNNKQEMILKRYIKKIDKSFSDVFHVSSDVFCYEYSNEWKEVGAEGPCYFVKKLPAASMILIANRKSMENFILEIDDKIKVEENSNFIILKKGSKYFGFWFDQIIEAQNFINILKDNCTIINQDENEE